ncbi:MAG: PEP-CTERM sorting domain-containing protein, partial [Planctomycetota bacterium]
LEEGQKFSVTVGYSDHNTASSGNSGTNSQNLEPRPNFHGGDLVANIGSGRYGLNPWNFPTYTDTGPSNRYHSGSFTFNPNPEPGTLLLVGGALSVVGVVRRRRRRKSAA